MDTYVTGKTIKSLREKRNLTQAQLAEMIGVSDKAVSKWECSGGYPDISLLSPLAGALKVSISELMTGNVSENKNISANLAKSVFYVCPVCGNVIHSVGECSPSCCGIDLIKEEIYPADDKHSLTFENVEDEIFVSSNHEMSKQHYISFIALVSGDRCDFVKLYPEGECSARFKKRGRAKLYFYCNRHGMFCCNI